jgi:hypothetical protein
LKVSRSCDLSGTHEGTKHVNLGQDEKKLVSGTEPETFLGVEIRAWLNDFSASNLTQLAGHLQSQRCRPPEMIFSSAVTSFWLSWLSDVSQASALSTGVRHRRRTSNGVISGRGIQLVVRLQVSMAGPSPEAASTPSHAACRYVSSASCASGVEPYRDYGQHIPHA